MELRNGRRAKLGACGLWWQSPPLSLCPRSHRHQRAVLSGGVRRSRCDYPARAKVPIWPGPEAQRPLSRSTSTRAPTSHLRPGTSSGRILECSPDDDNTSADHPGRRRDRLIIVRAGNEEVTTVCADSLIGAPNDEARAAAGMSTRVRRVTQGSDGAGADRFQGGLRRTTPKAARQRQLYGGAAADKAVRRTGPRQALWRPATTTATPGGASAKSPAAEPAPPLSGLR